MCINIIPQNGIIQVGLHCQLDDIDDFRGFAAEKCRTEDFVAFSINNSLQVTGSAAKQASPGTGCFCDFGNFDLMADSSASASLRPTRAKVGSRKTE